MGVRPSANVNGKLELGRRDKSVVWHLLPNVLKFCKSAAPEGLLSLNLGLPEMEADSCLSLNSLRLCLRTLLLL